MDLFPSVEKFELASISYLENAHANALLKLVSVEHLCLPHVG